MKICSKCKEDKQLEDFSGTQRKDGTKRYNSWCKPCMNAGRRAKRREQNRPSREVWLNSVRKPKVPKHECEDLAKARWDAWYANYGESMRLGKLEEAEKKRQALLDSGVKHCSMCDQEKPLHRFHTRNRKRKDGSSYATPYSHCKDCRRVDNRKHSNSPTGKKSKQQRRVMRDRRNKQATPKWLSQEQKQQIVAIYEHMRDCRAVTGEEYHVDHIVPLRGENVCGLHVPWNLQVLPAYVNITKSNSYSEDPPMDHLEG